MRLVVVVTLSLFASFNARAQSPPSVAVLEQGLAVGLNVDAVKVYEVSHQLVRSHVAFPFRAAVYSAWHGDVPVRTPDFYWVSFVSTKGEHQVRSRCTLRSYHGSHQGAGWVDPGPEHVILANECSHQTRNGSANPADADVNVDGYPGPSGERVVFYLRR